MRDDGRHDAVGVHLKGLADNDGKQNRVGTVASGLARAGLRLGRWRHLAFLHRYRLAGGLRLGHDTHVTAVGGRQVHGRV